MPSQDSRRRSFSPEIENALKDFASSTDRRARKIRKLRFGFHLSWIGAVIFALAGVALFAFSSAPSAGWMTFFYSAIFAALTAWRLRRQLHVEMIDDPRKREWVKAKSSAAMRNRTYWIALFALPLAPMLWTLNWFSVLPLPISAMSPAWVFVWLIVGVVGAMLIAFGMEENMEPPPPDLSPCDHEYDTAATPIRYRKCGRELTEQLRDWTNSTRPKRMFQLASAYILLAVIGVSSAISPTMKTVLLAKRPAKALIAELGAKGHWSDDQDNWTELMTRMPLAPADRQRLVDRVIALTITNHPPLSIFVTGLERWTASALLKTATYEESIDNLLTYIETTWPPPSFNDNHALLAAMKIVYMIDLADLPASQRDRAVHLAFSMANYKPNPLTSLAKIDAWLYRAFMDHSLSNEENERVLNVVHSSDILQLMALRQLRASTDQERSRLAALRLRALGESDAWSMSYIDARLLKSYIKGGLTQEQSQRTLARVRAMKYSWILHDLAASTPGEERRLTEIRLAALENTRQNMVYWVAKPIFSDYIRGNFTTDQSGRLRAILPSVMERGGWLTVLQLLEPTNYNTFTEAERVRLADLALRVVWSRTTLGRIIPPKVRNWLDDRSAAGRLTDEQRALYEQELKLLDNH